MSVNWTAEQQQVIESRNRNLLVSAAAGSGKTAVLVERIIQMVTDKTHPIDIDKLLVMTFTNAAAAEMRERVGAAIEQKLRETPEDEHLQIQAALVHHAQITTIDSFCLNLIRNHFDRLELDPSFKIGDEGELTLLGGDVMHELLEDYYQDGGNRFERFVETYAQGKGDYGIEDYIMQVYHFAQSNPYPERWLKQCREELLQKEADSLEDTLWMKFLVGDLKRQAEELRAQMSDALRVCEEDEYLCAYVPMFAQDVEQLAAIGRAEGFEELYSRIVSTSWARLATVRSKEVDGERKSYVTGCRDRMKKAVGKMQELYCFASPDEMARDLEETCGSVEMLLELTEAYCSRYQEKKRERNRVDFYDLEHEALNVLIEWSGGTMCYTQVADEVSAQYEEVLVDEYQDSNMVQETLLYAVSRERFGTPNVFMVGDVKQSIYRFRLARPELFLEKYHTYHPYGTTESLYQKIELHQNFRSREAVLAGTNEVFYKIMTPNLGNIHYTTEVALHPGAHFSEGDGRMAGNPELLVLNTGAAGLSQLEDDIADFTAKEIEAKLIASQIRDLTDPEKGMLVWDKKWNGTGGYRRAQYRDIVILLRSTSGWTEELMAVLMNQGIPAYAESRTGYFNTIEVETVLAMLTLMDNPMNDIPLAAVLKSPIAGVSDAELAVLVAFHKENRIKNQDRGLYGAIQSYRNSPVVPEESLRARLGKFWMMLEAFRIESAYMPIPELIYKVFEKTGYYDYVSAMAAGETRKANLDMLVEKAAIYEKTSYKGLFHFIRYIENLKKYNTDFGEATTVGEEDDTVRIMSIHKSKGLEFPIVFLAGMGKKFNKQDVYSKILIDPELGIATDYMDLELRLKSTTLKKNVLRRKMELDSMGEELRVLYVAMTRAKEQLILTGTDRNLEKTLEKYSQIQTVNSQIPYTILSTAGSYLDWIVMSMSGGLDHLQMREIALEGLVGDELQRQIKGRERKETLLAIPRDAVYDKGTRQMLMQHLEYEYPHRSDISLYTKMSVSELKRQGQMTDEGESVRQTGPLDEIWEKKEAVQKTQWKTDSVQNPGAIRGTAYHRAMELLPFDRITCFEDVDLFLKNLVEHNHFTQESYELVQQEDIWAFIQSNLGRRMAQAQRDGRLYKERQFVMGIPAREMGAGDSDELIVVQGIIDAYMEEDGELVLMDYKTDKVYQAEILKEHYKKQLDYYERALKQMTGKSVKEKIIYSMTLQQEIVC